MRIDARAEGAGHDLGAEADAEQRRVGGELRADPRGLRPQEGMLVDIAGAHRPAEHHGPVVALQAAAVHRRQGRAAGDVADLGLAAARVQRLAHPARIGALGMGHQDDARHGDALLPRRSLAGGAPAAVLCLIAALSARLWPRTVRHATMGRS